jgi:hypothetical protein
MELTSESEFVTRDQITKFKILTEEFCAKARIVNVEIKPYESERLPFFCSLKKINAISAVKNLETRLDALKAAETEGADLKVNSQLLKVALKKFGISVPNNLFEDMSHEDIIEFYDVDSTQIFTDFNFFRYCGYSLEELYSRPYFELWQRDPFVTARLGELGFQALTGKITDMIDPKVPVHTVVEKYSSKGFISELLIKKFGPIFNEMNVPCGAVVVEKCNPIKMNNI